VDLLNSVGVSLLNLPEVFGSNGRPGSLVGMCSVHILDDVLVSIFIQYFRLFAGEQERRESGL